MEEVVSAGFEVAPPRPLKRLLEGAGAAAVDAGCEVDEDAGAAPPKRLPGVGGLAAAPLNRPPLDAVVAGCEVPEDAGAAPPKRLPLGALVVGCEPAEDAGAPPPKILLDALGAGLAAAPSGFLPNALPKRFDPDVAVELGAAWPLEAWLLPEVAPGEVPPVLLPPALRKEKPGCGFVGGSDVPLVGALFSSALGAPPNGFPAGLAPPPNKPPAEGGLPAGVKLMGGAVLLACGVVDPLVWLPKLLKRPEPVGGAFGLSALPDPPPKSVLPLGLFCWVFAF